MINSFNNNFKNYLIEVDKDDQEAPYKLVNKITGVVETTSKMLPEILSVGAQLDKYLEDEAWVIKEVDPNIMPSVVGNAWN